MAKPYSMDLRQRALARLEEGETSYEVAAALKVAVSSVIKWAARKRRLGSAAPGKMGGHRPYLIDGEHRAFVLGEVGRIAAAPDDPPRVDIARGRCIGGVALGGRCQRWRRRDVELVQESPCVSDHAPDLLRSTGREDDS